MYDRHLDGFVKAVELGSFSAAGAELYITGNSLMKQMNCLERDLGVRLFDRSTQGVTLTAAGREIYESALDIMDRSREAVARAKAIERGRSVVVRLASSVISPTSRVGKWWSQVAAEHPGIELEIVSVIDDIDNWMRLTKSLGSEVDAMVTPEHPDAWPLRDTSVSRPLFSSPASVCVPMGHRLASQDKLRLADLDGERIYLVAQGNSVATDAIREAILSTCPRSTIVNCPPYDAGVFNKAAHDRALMIHCLELGDVHPSMVNIELEGFALTFCLEYARNCGEGMREFADAVCGQAAKEALATA